MYYNTVQTERNLARGFRVDRRAGTEAATTATLTNVLPIYIVEIIL